MSGAVRINKELLLIVGICIKQRGQVQDLVDMDS